MTLPLGSRGDPEDGAVAAELAMTLPAVLLVLAMGLGAVQLGVVRLRAQDAAADVARSLARGDDPAAAVSRVAGLRSATVARRNADGLVCAEVTALAAPHGPLAGLRVSGESCALEGGR